MPVSTRARAAKNRARRDWKMVPLRANGQLAAAAYQRGPDETYRAFAIVVLATTGSQLSRISLFGDPALFEPFGLPLERPASGH